MKDSSKSSSTQDRRTPDQSDQISHHQVQVDQTSLQRHAIPLYPQSPHQSQPRSQHPYPGQVRGHQYLNQRQQYGTQIYRGQSYPQMQVLAPHFLTPPPPYMSQYSEEQFSNQQDSAKKETVRPQHSDREQYLRSKQYGGQQINYGPYPQVCYSAAHQQQGPYMVQYPPPPAAAHKSAMIRSGRRSDRRSEAPELEGWENFQDKKVRSLFVRKVYIILMLQLLFTLGIIALFVFEPNVKHFVQEHRYLYYMSLVIFLAVYIGLACFQSARRKFPTNFIVLAIFTVALSYLLGTISSFYNTEVVFVAVGVCATVCLLVSIFSFYTKFDFTSCGGILYILLLVVIGFGLIAIFVPSRTMTIIYATLGAIVFILYLAFDTQMMMGGKKYELSPEEYIFASVQLYIDIVNIFLFLLLLIGGERSEG